MSLFRRKPRGVDYRLVDGEVLNREAPSTFFIPTRAEREALKPGDLVKLLFEIVDPEQGMPTAERMWVEVVEVRGSGYVGSLDNEPHVITTIRPGSQIKFEPHHVIATWDESAQ